MYNNNKNNIFVKLKHFNISKKYIRAFYNCLYIVGYKVLLRNLGSYNKLKNKIFLFFHQQQAYL